MNPKIWGNYGWIFLHYVTKAYPENPTEDDKKRYREYIHALSYVLPCSTCSANMRSHIQKLPIDDKVLANRDSLVKWGIDLHNIVNQSTGKDIVPHSVALKRIDNFSKDKCSPWKYTTIILVLFIIVYIIYRLCKRAM